MAAGTGGTGIELVSWENLIGMKEKKKWRFGEFRVIISILGNDRG